MQQAVDNSSSSSRRKPGSILLVYDGVKIKMDYKVHPWTLPYGPTFGCSNSFQTNLSGFRRDEVAAAPE
jgi:hypothetical protein